jgi:hypothetical protein
VHTRRVGCRSEDAFHPLREPTDRSPLAGELERREIELHSAQKAAQRSLAGGRTEQQQQQQQAEVGRLTAQLKVAHAGSAALRDELATRRAAAAAAAAAASATRRQTVARGVQTDAKVEQARALEAASAAAAAALAQVRWKGGREEADTPSPDHCQDKMPKRVVSDRG